MADRTLVDFDLDLLATRAATDPEVTVKIGVGNGLGIVPTMLGSMAAPDFIAIRIMWGAVNELTTLTGPRSAPGSTGPHALA